MDAQMETVQAARYMTERLLRMAKQAAQCYKYGFKVANNYDHTVDLDTWNWNTSSQDATTLKIDAFSEYATFDACKGPILVVRKARWRESCAYGLKAEGLESFKTETDLWIHPAADRSCYELIAVDVDDMAIELRDMEAFLKILTDNYGF